MKFRYKRIGASVLAVGLAGTLAAGAFMGSSVQVQASVEMMPGIETIVNETAGEKPFRILEIVDEKKEAEIGYYVSGQEPFLKLYEYQTKDKDGQDITVRFSSIEEGLAMLPTEKLRREFVNNILLDAEGNETGSLFRDIRELCWKAGSTGDETGDYPLSYMPYEEKYFLSEGESTGEGTSDWKQVTFRDEEIRTVLLPGHYEERPSGDGDYTKEKQTYYPIRCDVPEDRQEAEQYRENIQGFLYSEGDGASAPYYVEFAEIDNAEVNENVEKNAQAILDEYDYTKGRYGYYENVYTELTEELGEAISAGKFTFPGDAPERTDGDGSVLVQENTDADAALLFTSQDEEPFMDGSFEEPGTEEGPFDVGDPGEVLFGSGGDAFTSGDSFSDMGGGQADFSQVFGDDEGWLNDAEAVPGGESQGTDGVDHVFADDEAEADSLGPETGGEGQGMDSEDVPIGVGEPLDPGAVDPSGEPASGAEDPGQNDLSERVPSVRGDEEKAGTAMDPFVYVGETLEIYPYYRYYEVGDLVYVRDQAEKQGKQDEEALAAGKTVTRLDGDITLEDGQYFYWMEDEVGRVIPNSLSVIAGRQHVAYEDVQKLPELNSNYYYRVKSVWFCARKSAGTDTELKPEDYEYFGWYYAFYPENQEVYLRAEEGKTATHYISDAEYRYTPGIGGYDFVPGALDDPGNASFLVQVPGFYYRGGYSNHDWLKRYVFHLQPDTDGMFEKFHIQVDTITRQEFVEKYGVGTYQILDTLDSGTEDVVEGGTEFLTDSGGEEPDAAGDAYPDVTGQETETQDQEVLAESANVQEAQAEDVTDIVDFEPEGTADVGNSGPEGTVDTVEEMVAEARAELFTASGTESETIEAEFQDGGGVQEASGEEFINDDGTQEISGEEFSDGGIQESSGEDFTSGTVSAQTEVSSMFTAGDREVYEDGFPQLEEYGLLYINSSLDEEQSKKVLLSDVPCIINQDKAQKEGCGILTAFADMVKNTDEDTDQHYVTQNVYFFNAKSTQGGVEAAWLFNQEFHRNFNPDAYEGAQGSEEELQGFEEILDYIDSENRYRAVGQSTSDGSGQDDPFFSDGDESKIEPLGKEISQARAVEYILNYQYKRSLRKKEILNVLEIQPAKSAGQLTEEKVLKMLGYKDIKVPEVESVTVCTSQNEAHKAENMFDGDLSTIWHTVWGSDGNSSDPDGGSHTITITLKNPTDLEGLVYYPRQDSGSGSTNGRFISMKVSLYDFRGNTLLRDYEQSFNYTSDNDKSGKECEFGFHRGVKQIKITEIEGVKKFASCAELKFLTNAPKVEITRWTASEFVGHIEDMNAKYDMIYIGDDGTNRNDLINGSDGLLYSHIGGARIANGNRSLLTMGQLDIDYEPIENPQQENITVNGQKVTVTRTKQIRSTTEYNTGEDGRDGVGSLRGSGNDITAQQCRELMDFVRSGYPVLLGDSLLSDGQVSAATVDKASYYWEFLSWAVRYENVASLSQVANGTRSLNFFGELIKPKIDFKDGKVPPEPPRAGETEDESLNRLYLTGEGLIYQFYVQNDSDAMPADTTYDCNLYLDLNFDGNLSDLEEQSGYLEIWDADGNVLAPVNGKYELRIGKQYTVERKVPENYYKLITWKLELVSNRNPSVRTSVTGYAKRKNKSGKKQEIKVLHIVPDKGVENTAHGTWLLSDEAGKFQKMIKGIEDFEIKITQATVTQYEQNSSLLDDKQMLILGFDDVVQNISNDNGQVDKILNFIRSGRSAIFAHDTTSFLNWDYRDTREVTADGKSLKDSWLWEKNRADWGLSLNKYFRELAGLDRYGITDTSHMVGEGVTISQLLKNGRRLTDGGTVQVGDQTVTVDFSQLLNLEGDVAYVTGGDRSSSYIHTQGYTNSIVNNQNMGSDNTTTSATKVNDGAITQYPYRIPETMPVATTHGQYYQLAMEKDYDINGVQDGKNDIVVWYCLSGNTYSNSPNDVRNNYYFYSNGNVIYTGVGHSAVDGDIEIQLFINAIVAAANVTAVQPDVSFVKSLDPAAEEEKFRYYMTDQANWTAGSDNLLEDDVELYFNVKDYNMVSASLSLEDQASEDMTVQFFVEDETNGQYLTPTEGEVLPTNGKLRDITGQIEKLSQYGMDAALLPEEDACFHLEQNNAYGLRLSDLEQYLYDSIEGTYVSSYPVYVRVTSTVSLYGKPVSQSSWAKIDLKQRLLYELD